MKVVRTISNPNDFIVTDYEPGLEIDFLTPPKGTALDKIRSEFDFEPCKDLSHIELWEIVGELLVKLNVTHDPLDFAKSMRVFTEAEELPAQLQVLREAFEYSGEGSDSDVIKRLLEATGVLTAPRHYPCRVYCHCPSHKTLLEPEATHFGFVASGCGTLTLASGVKYPLYPNTYFCAPGETAIEGQCQVEIISQFDCAGMLTIGGELEPWGRLRYIDGCSDSLLVPPVRQGDPCLNSLYFPRGTRQTQHTHPSLRTGIVVSGGGICKTPNGDYQLSPGKLFFLPPDTWHAFYTDNSESGEQSALTVVAFHPDSDFGPRDESHPMLNRTYFEFLHRLRSLSRTRGETTGTE